MSVPAGMHVDTMCKKQWRDQLMSVLGGFKHVDMKGAIFATEAFLGSEAGTGLCHPAF